MKSFLFCFWRLLVRFSLYSFKKMRIQFIFYTYNVMYYTILWLRQVVSVIYFLIFSRFVILKNERHSTWCVETCTTIIIYYIMIPESRSLSSPNVVHTPYIPGTNITRVHKYVKLCPQVHIGRPERSKRNFPSFDYMHHTYTQTHAHITRARTCTRPFINNNNNNKQRLVKFFFIYFFLKILFRIITLENEI